MASSERQQLRQPVVATAQIVVMRRSGLYRQRLAEAAANGEGHLRAARAPVGVMVTGQPVRSRQSRRRRGDPAVAYCVQTGWLERKIAQPPPKARERAPVEAE